MPPLIAIVGRPNVGKSTLFNRIIRDRRALVDDQPGVTRDRLYGEFEYRDRLISIADTGGLDLEDPDNIISGIREQAIAAVNEADLILFVVDVRSGLTPADQEIGKYLRRYNTPILLVINKVEGREMQMNSQEFMSLGFEESVVISAEHGDNVSDLLHDSIQMLPESDEVYDPANRPMQVSIIGRPNVGKSSTLNAIIGENRMIVSPKAGTTRDVVDVRVQIGERIFKFLDTAGIRKKSSIVLRVEAISVIKARATIKKADCVILVLDARDGVTSQDKALAGMVDKDGAGLIVALNKWDLIAPELTAGEQGDAFIKEIQKDLHLVDYAPIVSTSALEGQRITKLAQMLNDVADVQQSEIPPADLNLFLQNLIAKHPLPAQKGKQIEVFKLQQTWAAPMRFRVFVRGYIPANYLKFMERSLRENFNLAGVPVHLNIIRV